MAFEKPLLGWNAPGVEPPESLKNRGWEAKQKPPAPYFNWTFYLVDQALKELQQNALHKDQLGVAGGIAKLNMEGKLLGLSNVDNVQQMPLAGGLFKGVVTAHANTSYAVRQMRNMILSPLDADESKMQNGDIWMKYR